MFKKTAIVAGIGLALSATAQADYQWELGAGYAMGEISADVKSKDFSDKSSDDLDVDKFNVNATYYLNSVDTSKGPLSEAAFLDHASSLTVVFTDGEVDLDSLDDRLDDEDGQSYGVAARYVAEGPKWDLSGWLVDLAYERSEPGDAEIDAYSIGIGKYITDRTTLIVNYANVDVGSGGDTDGYTLNLEHMWTSFKLDASYGYVNVKDADDIDHYNLGGTYYLNNNLGFGASYSNIDNNGYEVQGFSVFSEWFINEQFAVSASYSQEEPDDIKFTRGDISGKVELEKDVFAIEALYRF